MEIQDDIPKYHKKGKRSKSNSSKRSDHKHEYEQIIMDGMLVWMWGQKCSICGRITPDYVSPFSKNYSDFDDGYNQAIAARQQAQLDAEKQQIENKRAIEKAEADAKVKKTAAEADANAKLISAQAEAEANKLLEQSLTDQILSEMWIEKWNGELPQYMPGDNDSVLVGFNGGK